MRRCWLPIPAMVFVLLAVPAGAGATTSGPVQAVDVDARGCILPTSSTGRLVRGRDQELAAVAVFGSKKARNACSSSDSTWRTGHVMLGRRTPESMAARSVDVQVRRVPTAADEEWLITRVGDREIRVQHEVDQCSPRAWMRVVETQDEVRIRYFRPKSRSTSCTLVLFFQWGPERVLKLASPLGDRRIVAELGTVRTEYLDQSCPWVAQSLSALIAGAPDTELARLADLVPTVGFGTLELGWTAAIDDALRLDDPDRRARIARGIRRDMRRMAYPDACTRQFELPSATSTGATRFVVGGSFDDADLLGLDESGAVTWSTRLEGAVTSLDTCPDATHALVVERVPGSWWATDVRVRVSFVDLRDGTVSQPHGVRRIIAESSYVDGLCTSGAERRGWLETTIDDFERPGPKVIVDEVVAGMTHRVTLPKDVVTGVLGDGFLVGQTMEPVDGEWTESPPGRLVRTDLRTGVVTNGPLLSARSYLLALSRDGTKLVTTHGPVRVWDVSSGIRLLQSHPDPHRDRGQTSGAWDDDGRFVLLDMPFSDDAPASRSRGRLHLLDPARGTFERLAGWPRDYNDHLGLATGGRLFTWTDFARDDESAGLRVFDEATNRWAHFAPATVEGSVEFVDSVP